MRNRKPRIALQASAVMQLAGLRPRSMAIDLGALSADLGPMLLRGVDRQVNLPQRLAIALFDTRHQWHGKHAWSVKNS